MARATLSSQAVIQAAAQILDSEPGQGLSIAALAQDLGVKPPSLYKHVDGMPGLQRGIMLRAKADLAGVLGRAAIGQARDDAVRSVSLAYRDWARSHPGQYPLTMRAADPADAEDMEVSTALVQVLYAIVSGYRIEGEDHLVDAIRYLRSALHGFVDLETSGAFRLPRELDRSFARVIDSTTTALAGWSAVTGAP